MRHVRDGSELYEYGRMLTAMLGGGKYLKPIPEPLWQHLHASIAGVTPVLGRFLARKHDYGS